MNDRMPVFHRPEGDIKQTGKIKFYPDGSWELQVASSAIFGGSGWEESDKWDIKRSKRGQKLTRDLERARRRAAARVRDIALCTPFRWFVTLTLSPDQIDRYSISEAVRRMRSWLDNRVRRKGLAYVLVPELHKDGAVHFHGFFNDADIGIIDSGTLKVDGAKAPRRPRSQRQRAEWIAAGAKPVYNVGEWSLGFSTAIELYGEYDAAIGYCCKYVTKTADKIGGRWYYSGGDLGAPRVEYCAADYRAAVEAGAYSFAIDGAGVALAILRGRGSPDGDEFTVFGL